MHQQIDPDDDLNENWRDFIILLKIGRKAINKYLSTGVRDISQWSTRHSWPDAIAGFPYSNYSQSHFSDDLKEMLERLTMAIMNHAPKDVRKRSYNAVCEGMIVRIVLSELNAENRKHSAYKIPCI